MENETVLYHCNENVGIITLDNYRIGAVEQIEYYSNKMEIPCTSIKEPNELIQTITKGKFDKEINEGLDETSPEKRQKLNDYFAEVKASQDATLELEKKEAEKAAEEAEKKTAKESTEAATEEKKEEAPVEEKK